MEHTGRKTMAVKLISVVCSIIFLWAAGVSMLCVLFNLMVGFADSGTDFNQVFLSLTKNHEEQSLLSYATLTLRQQNESLRPQTAEKQASLRNMLQSFQMQFDPERTNLRFAVTDLDGKLLLSNDPDYGKNQKRLVTDVRTESLMTSDQNYQTIQHFDADYDSLMTLLHSEMRQYLSSEDDYKIWYFSNDLVDSAYHNGFSATLLNGEYTDWLIFPTLRDAQAYDYNEDYGDYVSWLPVSSPDEDAIRAAHAPSGSGSSLSSFGGGTDGADAVPGNVVVRVTAYADQELIDDMTLEKYFAQKKNGIQLRAADPDLEQALSSGLDVTITGSHRESETVYLYTYLPEDLPVKDTIRANYQLFRILFDRSEWFVALMFVFIILTVIASISMCTAAGYRGKDILAPSRVHSMAYEIFWLLPLLVLAVSFLAMALLTREEASYRTIALFGLGLSLCISLCCILWLYTTAVRVKCGTFWKSFFVVRVGNGLFSLIRSRAAAGIFSVFWLAFLFFINIVSMPDWVHSPVILLPVIAIDLLTVIIVLYCIYSYFELHGHVSRMETGDFTPAEHILPLGGDFGRFDDSLNRITGRVGDIVAQQTKAEHLRTELITNVSHDLKTPLTSIVNYVDLLSRQEMPTPEAKEYLDVLRRQAARLKKLTIDLVDASKASTGNLTVELVPTALQVLIEQLSGEYEDRFAAQQLSLICNLPTEPLMILADGRQIWRVFDNLLGNACKYALTGTRVYLDLTGDEQTVTVSLKNVSASELNISPDELMERFVRGDSSRHTEGSGLGLSIARDLTALQNGRLSLHTDGDLFKATLTFPRYYPDFPAVPEG